VPAPSPPSEARLRYRQQMFHVQRVEQAIADPAGAEAVAV
jgi:hypothetical protein